MTSLSATQKLKIATDELARQRYIWNTHIHWLTNGFYPPRNSEDRVRQFKGTDQEKVFEIFKIMDGEVRHLADVLKSVNAPTKVSGEQEAEIFDQISERTGLKASSHDRS